MMYFTSLPDHATPGFREQEHFSKFKKHNIIFNAISSNIRCDHHVGCLSLKTVLHGEEWYGINNRQLAVRPGQFLILNDAQNYSCRIDQGAVRSLSIFFRQEFASSVFHDVLHREETMLDDPFCGGEIAPEFIQTLHAIDPTLQRQLTRLVASLERNGYQSFSIDEYLVFLLRYLIDVHRSDARSTMDVRAIKSTTRKEIFKRLCIAKDLLHTDYMNQPDLNAISTVACMSVPQLVRQFRAVFHATPHQYLVRIRLQRAVELLVHTNKSVTEITWACGFENASAFGRTFKSAYGIQPGRFRKFGSSEN